MSGEPRFQQAPFQAALESLYVVKKKKKNNNPAGPCLVFGKALSL